MATHKVAPSEITIAHVGKYMRLSIAWPMPDGSEREAVVTGVIDEVRHTAKRSPERPLVTEVLLDLGSTTGLYALPDDGGYDIGDTIDDLYPLKD